MSQPGYIIAFKLTVIGSGLIRLKIINIVTNDIIISNGSENLDRFSFLMLHFWLAFTSSKLRSGKKWIKSKIFKNRRENGHNIVYWLKTEFNDVSNFNTITYVRREKKWGYESHVVFVSNPRDKLHNEKVFSICKFSWNFKTPIDFQLHVQFHFWKTFRSESMLYFNKKNWKSKTIETSSIHDIN